MNIKRTLAALLVPALLITAGCGSQTAVQQESWYARLGSAEVTPGLYKLMLLQGVNTIVETNEVDYDKAYSTPVGDKTGEQYTQDYADSQIKLYCYVKDLAARKNITLSETDSYMANYYAASSYTSEQEMFDALGVTGDDLEESYLTDSRMTMLFDAMYGVGGEFEIPAAEKQQAMDEAYFRTQYIYMDTTGEYDENDELTPYTDAELTEMRAQAQGYLDRYNAGEDFGALLHEYEDSMAEEDETADEDAAEEDEEHNHDYYMEKEDASMPEEMAAALPEMAVGEARLIEGEDYIVVLLKLDVNGTDDEVWQSYALALLQEQYGEEFTQYLNGQAEAAELEYNEAALSLYNTTTFMKALDDYIFDARVSALG